MATTTTPDMPMTATDNETSASTPGGMGTQTGAQSQTTSSQTSGSGAPARRGAAPMSPRDPFSMMGNPFAMMRQFADQMDRMFEGFGFPSSFPGLSRSWASAPPMPGQMPGNAQAGMPPQSPGYSPTLWSPQIEVSRKGDNLVVCADLPGMSREDVHVEIREDHLVLEGERRQESRTEAEGSFYRTERSYGRFYRAIPLPDGVDPDMAQARFQDGVLEVTVPLPQQPPQRTRKIDIR